MTKIGGANYAGFGLDSYKSHVTREFGLSHSTKIEEHTHFAACKCQLRHELYHSNNIQIVSPEEKFKKIKTHHYFICQPVSLPYNPLARVYRKLGYFLNQACTGRRSAFALFLRIASVCKCLYV